MNGGGPGCCSPPEQRLRPRVLTGCSQFDSALGQRQAIVSFQRDIGPAAGRALGLQDPHRGPAAGADHVNTPYPLPQVIYQINHASNADVAKLETCLSKFHSVAGVTLQDSSDQGN